MRFLGFDMVLREAGLESGRPRKVRLRGAQQLMSCPMAHGTSKGVLTVGYSSLPLWDSCPMIKCMSMISRFGTDKHGAYELLKSARVGVGVARAWSYPARATEAIKRALHGA